MNFFLHINKNLIFFFGLVITLFFLIIIYSKQFNLDDVEVKTSTSTLPHADISEPKFAINNEIEKIYITAKEGNFLNENEILNNNVSFKSNEFSIETDSVIFDRNKQTAQSKARSLFKSQNTTISSDGFNIYDKGDKIVFYGNSFIVLK